MSTNVDQLASRLQRAGRDITRANRVGVEKACLAGKGVMLSALTSGDGPSAVLAGAGMFLLAAFSPFVLFSLIPLAAEIAQPQRADAGDGAGNRPDAAHGKTPRVTSRPLACTSASVTPTQAISGSV